MFKFNGKRNQAIPTKDSNTLTYIEIYKSGLFKLYSSLYKYLSNVYLYIDEFPESGTQQHLMVMFPFWRSGECESYLFIAITPRSTMTKNGCTYKF